MKKVLFMMLLVSSPFSMAKEIQVKVSGMVCSMCAQGIQKKFRALPEVKEVKVDLDSKLALITTHGDKDVTDGKIQELIKEAGYNVSGIERK
jgi:mercuric ion binding protein